jgi:surfeit locus 1 family protein
VSPAAATKKQRSWIGPLISALFAFAVLVALGTWQIERKAWKEGLIAALTERLAAPPTALPPPSAWSNLDRSGDEYRRVRFTATFENSEEALVYGAASAFRPDASGPGYWIFTPARLADGSLVIVDRGFVPEARKDKAARAEGEVAGPVEIVGVLRRPDARHWYSPADDPAHNLWFTRDPTAIADAKGISPVAPFYVEQESPIPPGGWPQPGKLVVRLRNEHLQYALTWYGLAVVLVVVFIAWARKSGREVGHAPPPRRGASPSL